MGRFILSLLFLLCTSKVFAEYAWIAPEKTLFLRGGWTYLHSKENFDSDGFIENIFLYPSAISSTLNEHRFWLEPEYGFAPMLSGFLRFEFVNASVTPLNSTGSVSTARLGDVFGGLKWQLLDEKIPLTLETRFKIPTYGTAGLTNVDLSPGDGNADVLMTLHAGYRKSLFFVTAATGFNFRFGGYAPALLFSGAAGAKYKSVYAIFSGDLSLSLSENLLFGSSLTQHTAVGAGGTYSRLSGSPSHFDMGIKLGVKITPDYAVETAFKTSLWGIRYPNYYSFNLNLLIVHDFYEPPKTVKMKEVPFNEDIY